MNDVYIRRFQKKVEFDILSGCWLWISTKDADGYGQFWHESKLVKAHRISYEHWNDKIPKGLVIEHLCRTKNCVNPQHLEAITVRQNIERGMSSKHDNYNRGDNHWKRKKFLQGIRG